MATTAIFLSFFFFFSTLVLANVPPSSATLLDCTTHPPKAAVVVNHYHTNTPRKMLLGRTAVERKSPNYDAEMRGVPSGPDPMHHSSGPQKRPRISP